MKQLFRRLKQVSVLILAIAFIGCEEDDVVLPQVVAGFTHTIDEDTRTVTFINTSENANKYSWSFGDQDATASSLINPVFTYPVGAYTIVLTATNVAGASDTFEDTLIFLDLQVPLITLIGDATINLTLGDTFTDPGATALDEVDGDLTANIVVGGDTVDVNAEGTYVITYDVSDAQGNAAIQVERTVIVTAISCEAETEESLAAANLNVTFMSDPGATIIQDGTTFGWIDNPDFDNAVNASCKVAEIVKNGDNPWDNTQINLDAKLDFNANTGLKIKVWSARPDTEVRVKLEEIGTPANATEQFLITSVTSAWEELTFPFTADDSNRFDKIVIFFDLNADNTDTYYFDDLMLYGTGSGGGTGGGGTGDNLLVNGDFEGGMTAWSGNAFNIQEDAGNSFNFADVTTAGNPFDVNLSQVVEIIQGKNYTLSFDASSGGNRTIIAGIGLNQDPWTSDTVDPVNLTSATQNFSFDFTASFGNVNSRVLFDMGADIGTVVIDNVVLTCSDCDGGSGGGGGTGGGSGSGDNLATNGDFETGDDTGWFLFQNGGTSAIDNTVNNGGSWSGKIATGGPSNPALKQERIGAGTVAAGDVVQVSFDHIGAVAGEGGVFNVILFGEGAGGAVPFTHIFSPAPTLAGTWSTFTGTFAIPGGTDVSEGISFLIESVCGGAAGCSVSANIDNVSVILNP